ncbi:MAG: DUF1987 domain-containing protein [Bacteroidetes bacterium]|jgi:hypothetical protein|nr:DUF1987 domain-containing protein [Bacteroidota bacterium]
MKIEATRHTPLIVLDEVGGSVMIAGVSIPENAYVFFRPIEEFIEALDPELVKSFSFTFRLEYMNTLSSKAFLDYMRIVKDLKQIPLSVMWEYYSDDEEMRDHGETFSEIVDIPFTYASVDPTKRVPGRK